MREAESSLLERVEIFGDRLDSLIIMMNDLYSLEINSTPRKIYVIGNGGINPRLGPIQVEWE